MKKMLLLLLLSFIGSKGFSQCTPITSTGTSDGDFIQEVDLENIGVISGASSLYPYYSDFTSGTFNYFQTYLTVGNFYTLYVLSGTYATDYYAAWIDYNDDGDFYDVGEKLGEVQSTVASQWVQISFTVPVNATTTNLRLRIRCAFNGLSMDPCATYTYGETEDYNIVMQPATVGYCVPTYSNGTSGGDYINGVELGNIYNISGANTQYPYFTDYTNYPFNYYQTNLTMNLSYSLAVFSGTYAPDYFAAWIDYNNDGDFYDAGEKLGEISTSTSGQTVLINFTVPTTTAGNKRMRVRCAYNAIGMDPCAGYGYGETEDYNVVLIGGSTGPCTSGLHAISCSTADAIDDVYLFNSTLYNMGTGCNGSTDVAYTQWPASGSTTTTVQRNQTYALGVTSLANSTISAWFDWNHNNIFESSEWYEVSASSTAGTASEIWITVPSTAVTGNTNFRIRTRVIGYPNGPSDACTYFGSGETEDYTINVSSSTCIAPVALYGVAYNGSTFDYYDLSANFPFAWNWTFSNAIPSSSTAQNPASISYTSSVPGCHGITLTSSNSCGNSTIVRPCVVSIAQPTGCADLLISEYIEGSNNNKALEIFNASGNSINLNNYSVETYANGASTPTYSLNLSGVLASHDVYVISHPSATLAGITGNSDITSNVCFFDGNDVVVLKKNGVIIDKIGGLIGVDNVTPYDVNGGTMAEYTLVRQYAIDRPNTYWPDVAAQWDIYSQNTTSNLGTHNSTCGVGVPPVANFMGNPLNITVGQGVNFTDLSTGNPSSWTWSFTGGSPASSTLQNPYVIYNSVGCFPVTLTVFNPFGNDSHSMTCYVNVTSAAQAPVANFTANVFNITTGQTVNFTDLSTNSPTAWNWQFTGGSPSSSTLQNPTGIQYNVAGCYQVQLTASNIAGSDVESQVCYINVSNPGSAPLANFTVNSTSICAGGSVNFTDISSNSPTTWNWQFPGGNPSSSTQQNPSGIVYNSPGTYNVTLTAINGSGSNSLTIPGMITVYANPVANAGTNQSVCNGGSVQLNASGGQNYSWTPTTGLSNPNIANPIASPAVTTTYSVVVSNGPCSSVATVTVNVNSVNASAGNDVSICQGATTNLNASGGTSYSWSPTTGLSNPNVANPVAFPSTTTTYTVTVTNNGCTGTDNVTVTVANPSISAGNDVTICAGDTIQLNVNGGSGYTWSPSTGLSNPNISNPLAFPGNTTTYTITGTVAGCTASDVIQVNVNPAPPVPSITFTGLNLESSLAISYQWNFNGTPIPGGTFQTIFPSQPGNYTVTTFDANGCSATSLPYTITTVGLRNNSSSQGVVLAPNPSSDFALLTFNGDWNGKSANVTLTDALGQVISAQQVYITVGFVHKLEVQGLPAGIYYIAIENDLSRAYLPLIKQ